MLVLGSSPKREIPKAGHRSFLSSYKKKEIQKGKVAMNDVPQSWYLVPGGWCHKRALASTFARPMISGKRGQADDQAFRMLAELLFLPMCRAPLTLHLPRQGALLDCSRGQENCSHKLSSHLGSLMPRVSTGRGCTKADHISKNAYTCCTRTIGEETLTSEVSPH